MAARRTAPSCVRSKTRYAADRDDDSDDDHREPVRGIEVPEDHLALEQEAGWRDRVELATPGDRHDVRHDEEEAERQQRLVEVTPPADRP